MTKYNTCVIRTFADRETRSIHLDGKSRRLPAEVASRAKRKLALVDQAVRLEDLAAIPGNKLHPLSGDREGQHAICVNDKWRICFRFDDGDAFDVEVCDYH